ncbi:MAG: hypothetical protein ACT4QG_03000 [Sporichthyaceae bacterium]
MADLYIDAEVFARLRANLARTRELMERPGRDLAALDATAAGGRELSKRLDEFAEEWSYGIGRLAGFAADAAHALAQIEAGFRDIDDALTRVLRGGGSP